MPLPLMPKATAVWLIENTSLTFEQIAEFCGMHPLEVQAIADGDSAIGIVGLDPVANGQLTHEEIARCERDPSSRLQLAPMTVVLPKSKGKSKGGRYTPVAKRQDKPDGIAFLLRHHPVLSDAQICSLLGTTKETVQKVRDKTHWNSANIKPRDPVLLGLCTQTDLHRMIEEAMERARREGRTLPEATTEAAPQR